MNTETAGDRVAREEIRSYAGTVRPGRPSMTGKAPMLTTLRTVAAGILLLAGVAHVGGSDALKPIVDSYIQIQTKLAADTIDGLSSPAKDIVTRAAEMGSDGSAIAKAAESIEQAGDLKAAREAFGALSDAVIAAAKAKGWTGLDDVKLAYCPMADRSWLQREASIRNPYYGTKMLECGEFRDRSK